MQPPPAPILVLVSLLVAACATGKAVVTDVPPTTTVARAAADAWLVVGRSGEDRLRVMLASTGEERGRLPVGVPSETWDHVLTATPDGSSTVIQNVLVQPGSGGPRRSIRGAWRLPTVGLDVMPVGVAADGNTAALVEDRGPDAPAPATSRCAILKGALDPRPRVVELKGAFDFDAISPDGATLFVVEHLPAPPDGHYQVRAVDVATGALRDGVIVDKRNIDEQMGGWPIDQLRRPSGMVFTLYRGEEHPFIHALDTVGAGAVCIDLPATGSDPAEAARDWGVVASGNGRYVIAANATLGLVVDIDPTNLIARRQTNFQPTAGQAVAVAKYGDPEPGPVGRRVVAAPDGSAVFAAGATGIVRIAMDDLGVTARMLEGERIDALALTPDGSALFALRHADGGIVKLDATSGRIREPVPGGGFDRLVAVVP
ncbi:MAG: hypothetical protein ABJC39_06800 [Chloroflexota bacterium]